MAELGAVASIVGIATAAIKSVQILYTTIHDLRDVPDTIHNIKIDLESVKPVLDSLYTTAKNDSTEIVLHAEVKSAVENCTRACTAFQTLLDRWMRSSTQDRTFWKDRWRVGLFGQERIKALKGQLNDCKSTLTVTLSTATM